MNEKEVICFSNHRFPILPRTTSSRSYLPVHNENVPFYPAHIKRGDETDAAVCSPARICVSLYKQQQSKAFSRWFNREKKEGARGGGWLAFLSFTSTPGWPAGRSKCCNKTPAVFRALASARLYTTVCPLSWIQSFCKRGVLESRGERKRLIEMEGEKEFRWNFTAPSHQHSPRSRIPETLQRCCQRAVRAIQLGLMYWMCV